MLTLFSFSSCIALTHFSATVNSFFLPQGTSQCSAFVCPCGGLHACGKKLQVWATQCRMCSLESSLCVVLFFFVFFFWCPSRRVTQVWSESGSARPGSSPHVVALQIIFAPCGIASLQRKSNHGIFAFRRAAPAVIISGASAAFSGDCFSLICSCSSPLHNSAVC